MKPGTKRYLTRTLTTKSKNSSYNFKFSLFNWHAQVYGEQQINTLLSNCLNSSKPDDFIYQSFYAKKE